MRRDPRRDEPVEPSRAEVVYKIVTAGEWRAAEGSGRYPGSADDRRDGLIHFSTEDQTLATAAKHFAGQADLLLVSVRADMLGEALVYEPSRGGRLFPHLHGELPLAAVTDVRPLPLGEDGRHRWPAGITSG